MGQIPQTRTPKSIDCRVGDSHQPASHISHRSDIHSTLRLKLSAGQNKLHKMHKVRWAEDPESPLGVPCDAAMSVRDKVLEASDVGSLCATGTTGRASGA